MRAVLITSLLALAAGSTGAAVETGSSHGRTVDLYQEQSNYGETLDAFVVRIAPRAVTASKSARATLCGQLEGSVPYRVTMKTDGFLSTCELPKTALPYVLVNGNALDVRENSFSQVNWQRPGYLVTPWSVKYQDGRQKRPRAVR